MGYFAMLAFKGVTGGENGLSGLPRQFDLLGFSIADPLSMYGFMAGAFFLVFLLVQRVIASPFGSVLAAIRENEPRSEALGYPVARYKTAAVALAGGIAGTRRRPSRRSFWASCRRATSSSKSASACL